MTFAGMLVLVAWAFIIACGIGVVCYGKIINRSIRTMEELQAEQDRIQKGDV